MDQPVPQGFQFPKVFLQIDFFLNNEMATKELW